MKRVFFLISLFVIIVLVFFTTKLHAELSHNGVFDFSLLLEDSYAYAPLPDKTINQSIFVLNQLIHEQPENVELYIAIAHNYNSVKSYNEALVVLDNALIIDDAHSSLYRMIGETNELLGNKLEAIHAFKKMVEVDYLNYENHFKLGMAYLRRHQFTEARNEFKKTIEINPFTANAYYYLGLIALDNNKLEHALIYFLKSIKLQPELYHAYNNIGAIYLKQKRDNDSLPFFEESVDLNPQYDIGNFNLGRLLLKKGKYLEAKEKLETSLLQNQAREKTYYLLGLIYEQLNQIEESINHFSHLVNNFPQNSSYQLILAKLYIRVKKYTSAEECYVSIIKNGEADAYALVNYGVVLEKLKNSEKAANIYKEAIRQKPSYSRAHMLLARYYLKTFDLKNGIKELFKSGSYLYSSIMIIILVSIFVVVVGLALKIFFQH